MFGLATAGVSMFVFFCVWCVRCFCLLAFGCRCQLPGKTRLQNDLL